MPQEGGCQGPDAEGSTSYAENATVGPETTPEAKILLPKIAAGVEEVPTRISPSGIRYVRLCDVPLSLQDEFKRYLTDVGCPVIENEESNLAFETDWIEWRQLHRFDRLLANSAETSAAVMRTFPNVANEWGVQSSVMAELLGLDIANYHEWSAQPSQASLTVDQLQRASNLLGIYRSLMLLIPQGKHRRHWLHTQVDTPLFGGLSPMELMELGGLDALYELRNYLDAQRQGGFA